MRAVTTAVWAALAFFCFVVAVGVLWVGYHLYVSWRLLRTLPPGILDQVMEMNGRLADLEQRVTTVQKQVAELQTDVQSLSVALARARVVMNAAGEVSSAVASVRGLIPTK